MYSVLVLKMKYKFGRRVALYSGRNLALALKSKFTRSLLDTKGIRKVYKHTLGIRPYLGQKIEMKIKFSAYAAHIYI